MSRITDAFAVLTVRAASSLTLEELDELSKLTGVAGEEAQNLSRVCEGLAGLVLVDGRSESVMAGNLQDSDSVAYLLSHLAHSLDVISGLIDAGEAAQYRARVLRGQEGAP